jgi:prepilin-type processing-associated H-X9-DG protein
MEEEPLYKRFKLDEPWDSPANLALLPEIPRAFRCPTAEAHGLPEGDTTYASLSGPGTLFPSQGPDPRAEIAGIEGLIPVLVEARVAVPWTKPAALAAATSIPYWGIGGRLADYHAGGRNIVFLDGSVHYFGPEKDGASP